MSAADAAATVPSGPRVHAPAFFVLAGNPRSGTHALALRLEREGGVAMPTEARFASLFARPARLAGDLSRHANRRRLLRCVFAFLWLWERRNRTSEQLAATLPYSILGLAGEAEAIAGQCRDFRGIVDTLHARYAERWGAAVSVDKITYRHDDPVGALTRRVPGLKVVHVVRDGRDVCLSWRRVWFGVGELDEAALRWRRRVLGLRRLGRALGADYLEVRYEDFIARPEATCDRIRQFLALPPAERAATADDDTGTAPGKTSVLAEREGHDRLNRPLDPARAARWRRDMTAAERRLFEWLAGDALEAMGYPVSAGAARGRWWRRPLARLRAGGCACLRPLAWKQYAVTWLPAVLLVTDRLGLPVARRLHARAVAAAAAAPAGTAGPRDAA